MQASYRELIVLDGKEGGNPFHFLVKFRENCIGGQAATWEWPPVLFPLISLFLPLQSHLPGPSTEGGVSLMFCPFIFLCVLLLVLFFNLHAIQCLALYLHFDIKCYCIIYSLSLHLKYAVSLLSHHALILGPVWKLRSRNGGSPLWFQLCVRTCQTAWIWIRLELEKSTTKKSVCE